MNLKIKSILANGPKGQLMATIAVVVFCASLTFSPLTQADVAVIVHPSNSDTLTKDQIADFFLGKSKTFPSGKNAIPLDRAEGSDVRQEFLSKVVDKSESQMKSYWSRLAFTGKGVPPKVVESDAVAKELVSRNPDTIGFIDAASVDSSVKVLAKF